MNRHNEWSLSVAAKVVGLHEDTVRLWSRALSEHMSTSSMSGRLQQCDIEILRLAKKMIYEESLSLSEVLAFLRRSVKEAMEPREFTVIDALDMIKELRWKNIRPMTGEEPDAWFSIPHYEVDGFLEIAGICSLQRLRFTEAELQRILLGKVS